MNYVLKGKFKNQDVYFIEFVPQFIWGSQFDVRHCSEVIEGARIFTDNELEIAENLCNHLKDDFKIYPVCPSCGHEYNGYPAVSRIDNKTNICSECGIKEAFDFFEKYKKLQ